MTGQKPHKVQGEHTASGYNMSGQHRQHLHNPTGYTDEVAEEEREFMRQAEVTASGHTMSGHPRQHLHNPTGYTDEVAEEEREFLAQAEQSADQSSDKGKTGTLESGAAKLAQEASSTMESMKNKAKDTLNLA